MIYLLVLTFIVICTAIHEYEHKDSGYYEPIEKNKENKINEKLNIDLNKVVYDGRSFRLIVKDEKAFY